MTTKASSDESLNAHPVKALVGCCGWVARDLLAMNKHIYCAKPITRTSAEARRVKAAVLSSKVTTKASIQDSRSSPARATTELLLSGAIDPIREVHFWTGTHGPSGLGRPKEVQIPPEGMNWDQWCGPSPLRPYHKIYHYGNWRPWWDFGTGNLGDVACHALHVFHDELDMGAPDWVAANACQSFSLAGTVANSKCASIPNYVQWHFPACGKHPELMAYYYDGGLQPLDEDSLSSPSRSECSVARAAPSGPAVPVSLTGCACQPVTRGIT